MRIAFNHKLYRTNQLCREFLHAIPVRLEAYRLSKSQNDLKSIVVEFERPDDYVIFIADYLGPYRDSLPSYIERFADDVVVWDPLKRPSDSDHFRIEL